MQSFSNRLSVMGDSSATLGGHSVQMVSSDAGQNPVWFSPAMLALDNITNQQANHLLVFYGLPAIGGNGGAVKIARRNAIARHIGVRL